jgi:Sec-independent protein translocase protein TatA
MEILGIGTAELIAILLIMLLVAGPKRMIRWAYILGQYATKLRGMWAEVMTSVQKEFDAAGMDVKLPKDIPTRQGLTNHMNKAFSTITKPTQDVMNEIKAEMTSAETLRPTPQKVEE